MYFSETYFQGPYILLLLSLLIALLVWGTAVILGHIRMDTPLPSLLSGVCFLDLRSSSFLHLFPHFTTLCDASWDRAPVRYILVTCRSDLFSIWPSHLFSSLSEWNSMFMINFSAFWTLYPTVFWFPGLLLRSPVSFDTGFFLSAHFLLSGKFIGSSYYPHNLKCCDYVSWDSSVLICFPKHSVNF